MVTTQLARVSLTAADSGARGNSLEPSGDLGVVGSGNISSGGISMDRKRAAVLLGTLSVMALFGSLFLRASVKARGLPGDACHSLGARPLDGPLRRGQRAPDFALRDAAGKAWSLAALRGKPVLLHFWASWCAPCVREMPSVGRLSRRLGDALTVLTVSVDESFDEVKRFFPRGTNLPVLLDSDKQTATLFGTERFPESFLIDSTGRLEHLFHETDWDHPDADRCLAATR
jgi:thiol-disulfide isomerase/thioredoxin